MAESSANYWIHALLPILDETLGFVHAKPVRGKNIEEILKEFPELKEFGIVKTPFY